MKDTKTTLVDGDAFIQLYNSDRFYIKHNDYVGVINGMHTIYSYGNQDGLVSVVSHESTVITPVEALPPGFPEHPQPEFTVLLGVTEDDFRD